MSRQDSIVSRLIVQSYKRDVRYRRNDPLYCAFQESITQLPIAAGDQYRREVELYPFLGVMKTFVEDALNQGVGCALAAQKRDELRRRLANYCKLVEAALDNATQLGKLDMSVSAGMLSRGVRLGEDAERLYRGRQLDFSLLISLQSGIFVPQLR